MFGLKIKFGLLKFRITNPQNNVDIYLLGPGGNLHINIEMIYLKLISQRPAPCTVRIY